MENYPNSRFSVIAAGCPLQTFSGIKAISLGVTKLAATNWIDDLDNMPEGISFGMYAREAGSVIGDTEIDGFVVSIKWGTNYWVEYVAPYDKNTFYVRLKWGSSWITRKFEGVIV